MESWQKSHVAMVAPLGKVIYYDGGNNYTVANNKKAIHQMILELKENFIFLKRSGIEIEPFKLKIFLFLPMFILNPLMRFVYRTKWEENLISNHALNAKQEMDKISNDFLKLADLHGYNLVEFKRLSNLP